MCGIVGYIGGANATEKVINGLSKLEYRGYDSAGIATISQNKIQVSKSKGRINNLIKLVDIDKNQAWLAIGHTRWATHGQPSQTNAHPHLSQDGKIVVVHNGIIENYQTLKTELEKSGVTFASETDSEVVPNLIAQNLKNHDLLKAVSLAVARLKGSFALAIMAVGQPDEIIAVRQESPLVVGLGKGENILASDVTAIVETTKKVVYLENGQIAQIKAGSVQIFDFNLRLVDYKIDQVSWTAEQASKGGYKHFTLKEVYEQPAALASTLKARLDANKVNLAELDDFDLKSINRCQIVACGTAYHAGLIGKHLFENWLDLPTDVSIASEFRYGKNFLDQNSLVIAVSQSGETADTLGVIEIAKAKGAKVLAITNVVGSSITRLADQSILTWAGPEIGVCSTKAYTSQLMVFNLLTLEIGRRLKRLKTEQYQTLLAELNLVPELVETILDQTKNIKSIAANLKTASNAFFIGRGRDYYTAMEGALKLKEISYIHAEAFPAGELKHGTIALIEPGTPVISLALEYNLLEKIKSNIEELKARAAFNVVISQNDELEVVADALIKIPASSEFTAALLAAIPVQLLAYFTADALGRDVDKPRNLAKSVTVE